MTFNTNKTSNTKSNYLKIIITISAFVLLVFLFSGVVAPLSSLAKNDDINQSTNSNLNDESEIKLLNPGKLSIAVSPPYPPFIELQGNELVGFEPDLYREIAKYLNLELEEKIMNFDAILPAVSSGSQCDIAMSGISINPERSKTVSFSETYYISDISFIVREDSSIKPSNASHKIYDPKIRFAVQSGSTSEMYVRENFPDAKLVIFNNESDCFAAINSGQADIMCGTKAVDANLMKTTYTNMVDVLDVATDEEYAIAVSKDNPGLLQAINSALKQLTHDGTIQKLYAKYGINDDTVGKVNNLQTVKCVAKTNSLASNTVIATLETRITWEGQAADNEVVKEFNFILPQDIQFSNDSISLTVLSGDNLLSRFKPKTTVLVVDNKLKIKIDDNNQILPGSYFRIEIPEVYFPEYGGEFKISGNYLLNNGQDFSINDCPSIVVEPMDLFKKFAYDLNDNPIVKAWNSNSFLNLFFNPTLFLLSIPSVFIGFLLALATVLCAFPLALPFGLMFALMRISNIRVLRGISSVYVNIVRGTPLFLQIYIAFFGLPLAGINIPTFPLGLFVLAINSSAYVCEIFRAAIQAVPVGQTEAARSLGLNKSTTMLFIVIPQAIKQCIPTLTSEFILLYKDTSLLASVGVMEVVMFAKTIVAATGSITPYIVAALFYLVITIPLSKGVSKLEKRLSVSKSNRSKIKKNKQTKKIDSNKLGSM